MTTEKQKWHILLNPDDEHKIDLYWSEKDKKHMGHVTLVDVMPRIVPEGRTGDVAIVQGARVSYGISGLKSKAADAGLIEYLVEHYHTSPLELVEVKFICSCPLFVFNQLVRHRTANLNVTSRRYTEISEDTFYVSDLRLQDTVNKQGSVETKDVDPSVKEAYETMYEKAGNIYDNYKQVVNMGVAKEIARGAIPQNIMTPFIWKIDLHNFLKMVRLRTHSTAQKEIQDLANAMFQLVKPMFPLTCAAFEKHWQNSVTFSMDEISVIKKGKNKDGNYDLSSITSKRRKSSFLEKMKHFEALSASEPPLLGQNE